MRYSKGRVIATTIISISCFILVIFAIYKGIEFAKSANNVGEEPVVKANVTETKNVKKETKKEVTKTTKKETKQEKPKTTKEKQTETKTTETVKKEKVVKKEEAPKTETTKQEIKKEEEKEVPTYDEGLKGKYLIKDLTYQNKKYSKEEIDKLIKAGYSMSFEVKDGGLAVLSVLSINHVYVINDAYLEDGTNKIEYGHNKNTIRIAVDDAVMVFKKK